MKPLAPIILLGMVMTATSGAVRTALAGTAQDRLMCRATDGTVIEGQLPGDAADFDLTIKQVGKSLRFFEQNSFSNGKSHIDSNARLEVVRSFRDRVWTLVVREEARDNKPGAELTLYALPKTMRFKEFDTPRRVGYEARFTARVTFLGSDEAHPPDLARQSMTCSIDYSK